MKRKIIIGLSVFSLLFILSGAYSIMSIQAATDKLEKLIQLHQVSILREHLLIQIKRAQTDFYLKDTRYARTMDTLIAHVRNLDKMVSTCFECHHTDEVMSRLSSLHDKTDEYKNALSRVFTLRANTARLKAEDDAAFLIGTELNDEVNTIILLTNKKLEERTLVAMNEIAGTKKTIYIVLSCIPLLGIGFSVLFIRAFTKPAAELLTATRRLKAGDLDYRIGSLHDEFGEVAESFNAMAAALKEDYLKMQWAEQLVVLGEMTGGFAHEIKNPLAGIKASMEVLSRDQTISEENRGILLKGIDQTRKIEVTLKNLLNFAQPPKPQLSPVNINSVIDSTIGNAERHPLLSPKNEKKVTIIRNYDAELPEVMADSMQLQQVFLNLLLNSADAMPDGGTITIKTDYQEPEGLLRIVFTDTGHGIDEKIMDKIFQPFFTTKVHGTGLGLAITKRLVDQHNGVITAANKADKGVEFCITLPVTTTKKTDDDEVFTT